MSGDKLLAKMIAEVREVNTALGWRQPGKTFGDFIALLNTEISEMTDAYRDWGLEDATEPLDPLVQDGGEYDYLAPGADYQPPKPRGVGSELADVLIRALDTADTVGVSVYGDQTEYTATLHSVGVLDLSNRRGHRGGSITPGPLISFGDHASLLHRLVDRMWDDAEAVQDLLLGINLVAKRFDIDLMAEYERKLAFNRTRDYRHGGKLL